MLIGSSGFAATADLRQPWSRPVSRLGRMTDDALAVLEGMYAAEQQYLDAGGPGRASFETLAPFFAPDVVLHQADALPYGGTWRGHAGMERFFVAMSAAWESFAMLEQEFHPAGDVVVVRTQVRATARTTGRKLEFPILQTVRVAEGRITEVWPFYWDTAAIADACGGVPRNADCRTE